MAQEVLKFSTGQLNSLKKHYDQNISKTPPAGALFRADLNACVVTAYKSGKVLFQGKSAANEASKWRERAAEVGSKKTNQRRVNSVESHKYMPPNNIANLAIIGSDEVGTGDYFGPLVVAAVFSRKEDHEALQSMGVRDSKDLSDEKISTIAKKLIPKAISSVLVLPNEKYNNLQAKGYNQNKIKAILHNQALMNVTNKLNGQYFDGYLVDQFATPNNYFKALAGQEQVIKDKISFKTKAESAHLSVACASIIARYRFLEEMDQLSLQSGIELPKGASSKVDEAAAQLIRSKGEAYLQQVAKVHFGNTEKAKKLV